MSMGDSGFPGHHTHTRGVVTEGRQQIFGQPSMMPQGVLQEQYIQHLEAAVVARENHIAAKEAQIYSLYGRLDDLATVIQRQAETIANLTSQEAEEPEKRRGTL